jgi:DNA-binding IclR family transcriptional regulator
MTKVPAAAHTLELLRTLASRGPASASTLAAAAGIPRSSTYHLLSVLRDFGYVVHLADDHRWTLGPTAFEVGMAYLRHDPREAIARPLLIALADQVDETTHLGVLQGTEVLYLLKENPTRSSAPTTLITGVGVRLPAATTASGRAILAQLPSQQVRALMSAPGAFTSRTGHGPQALSQLRTALAAERRQGYSIEVEEVLHGYASIAVPVFTGPEMPGAAVSITIRAHDNVLHRLTELSAPLLNTAQALNLLWQHRA